MSTIEDDITSKFLTEKTLQDKIEDIVWEVDCTHLEAMLIYCERNSTDAEEIKTLVSSALRTQIMEDAVNAGLMNTGSRLPI